MIIRVSTFFAVLLTGIFLPIWVFICGALLYAFFYTPYELLIIGVYIDAQFGDVGSGVWYLYTAISAFLLILSIVSKPYLRYYT